MSAKRITSDEAYIVALCDETLGTVSLRQHRFDFLRGDAVPPRLGARLPVDAYYPALQLVVEYRERQHTTPVPFFDKVNRMTISGVHRGRQRELYDQRRREVLPRHGITLIELSVEQFAHDGRGRLLRNRDEDKSVVRRILSRWVRDVV
jgi:hypothetical protein